MESLPDTTFKEIILWLLRRRKRFRVDGDSMAPLLNSGDEVLVDPFAYRHTPPSPGDIVIARHPFRSDIRLIKRIAGALPNAHYDLRGDNPQSSSDSRTLGAIPLDKIIARATCKFF